MLSGKLQSKSVKSISKEKVSEPNVCISLLGIRSFASIISIHSFLVANPLFIDTYPSQSYHDQYILNYETIAMTNKETYVESISWRGRLPAWIILLQLTLSQKLEQPTCVHSHEIFIHIGANLLHY